MRRIQSIATPVATAGAVLLTHLYLQRLEADVSGGPNVVLVAAEDLPLRAAIAGKSLAVRDLPQAYVEARHIKANDHRHVLSGLIQNGMRAVTKDVSRGGDRDNGQANQSPNQKGIERAR